MLPVPGSNHQVLVIDDFMPAPHKLIDYAVAQQQPPGESPVYPGLRAPVPPGYLKYAIAAINRVFQREKVTARVSDGEAYFAMVTRAAKELTLEQSIPHFDRPLLNEFAIVHYLCSPAFGGTSFYRYKPTAQVAITRPGLHAYQQNLAQHLQYYPAERGYINGDTPLFERVLQVPCEFNRAVIYPCALLHSGDISKQFKTDLNPYTARFTVTAFLR